MSMLTYPLEQIRSIKTWPIIIFLESENLNDKILEIELTKYSGDYRQKVNEVKISIVFVRGNVILYSWKVSSILPVFSLYS